MRPGFSTAYTSRREAFEAEAMSSSGHRLVPPKKSVNERKQMVELVSLGGISESSMTCKHENQQQKTAK